MATLNSGLAENSSFENASTVSNGGCFASDSVAIKVSRILAYCVVMLVSGVGNSLIIYIVAKERRMQKTVNYFIVNMAAADLLITLFMARAISLAYVGYQWQVRGIVGLVFCKLAVLFHETAIAVSNFTVVTISLDRFFAVVFPLKLFITKRVCAVLICFIWLVAIILRIPMVYAAKTVIINGELSCYLNLDEDLGKGAEKAYYYFTLIGLFSIPFFIMVILYSAIFITIRKRKPPGDHFAQSEHQLRKNRTTKMRVLRMVSIVVGAFVLCWLMYFIGLVLYSYKISMSCNVLFLKLFLAHFNSALNPCLYVTFSENFRKSFKNFFARLPCFNYAAVSPVITRERPA